MGQALLALPRLGGLRVDDPVGLGEGLGKAPGCLVDVAGLPRSTMFFAPTL
ncbi:MAG TPA: hypothetical protein VNB92_09445 [Rubrobacter sp.]|nr:hypothetical protein [Rubrobacter sp.]